MAKGLYTKPDVEKRRRVVIERCSSWAEAAFFLGDITPTGIYLWGTRRGLKPGKTQQP